MSDEETQILHTEDGQMLTAEYKDGQLQIVEVAAFDKGRYVQVLDNDKGVMSLDLLSLIKSDGSSTYQLVGTSTGDDNTVTCVLAKQDSEENEENENQDSYVIVDAEEEGRDPLVYLQSTLQQINTQQTFRNDTKKKKQLTPEQILEKAKALQKANIQVTYSKSGRKRKGEVPQPAELLGLLSSPGFKLYLYSCKQCSFKCNAIKEMSKHKATEHMPGRGRGSGRSANATLQCARCPYRASAHTQLVKHVNETHFNENSDESTSLVLDCEEVSQADVLVCGACGFESGERAAFRTHIETAHGLNVTLTPALITMEEDTESN